MSVLCQIIINRCLHIALLSNLGDSVAIHSELRGFSRGPNLQDGVELTMCEDVGVAANGGGEVRIHRDI